MRLYGPYATITFHEYHCPPHQLIACIITPAIAPSLSGFASHRDFCGHHGPPLCSEHLRHTFSCHQRNTTPHQPHRRPKLFVDMLLYLSIEICIPLVRPVVRHQGPYDLYGGCQYALGAARRTNFALALTSIYASAPERKRCSP